MKSFNSLINGLRNVISKIYNRPFNDQDLSVFLGYAKTYISNFRDQIKNREDKSARFNVEAIYRMKETVRIRIIEYSNGINSEFSEELNEISKLFNCYKNNVYCANVRNNQLYNSLAEFQFSLTTIFKSIGEIIKPKVSDLESAISMNLRYYTHSVKNNPLIECNSRKFVELYNKVKIKYKDQLKQHGLEQEFESIFFDLFKTFKDLIVRSEHKGTVRGQLLQGIINLLPEDFYIDRNTFSKLIFKDEYYLMKTYFHPDKLYSYPKTQTYNKMEKTIRSIKIDSVYIYAGKPLSRTNLSDLKRKFLELIRVYKKDYPSSKTTLPESVMRYYMEYYFGGNFERDSAVSWLTTVGEVAGELDGIDYDLNVAMEFNGPQHYKLIHWMEVYRLSESYARERFSIQNINDLNKLRECKEKGTVLIILSFQDDPNTWGEKIIHQYELWTGKKAPVKQQLSYEEVLRLISNKDIRALKRKFVKNFSV